MTHHDLVFSKNCTYGEGFKAIGPCNIYSSEFGHDCFVGPFCEIGGAKIGDRTKISSHSYICPGVTIGEDCFVAHNVSFTNDLFDGTVGGEWTPRKTKVGNRVRIGSGTVILPVSIGDDVKIGAGSVVVCDIPAGETWAGNPAGRLQ